MITAYFSKIGVGNLFKEVSTHSQYAVVDDFEITKANLTANGFVIKSMSDFKEPGIYNICLGVPTAWGKIGINNKHVIDFLPKNVILAACTGKLKIVLNTQGEGWPMMSTNFDGYRAMHNAMKRYRLPKFSVIVIDSNMLFEDEYHRWCCENDETPMFKHCYFLTGFYYFDKRIPDRPLYLDAIENIDSKDFNSLNRTPRHHRVEHLYRLIKTGEYKSGLVSGDMKDFHVNNYVLNNANRDEVMKVIQDVGPLSVDGEWFTVNPDLDSTAIFNHSIYKNSLLSVITESAYHHSGMFITEKVFKPIVAGHPFIVLGQHNILKTLNYLGYRTDFFGIDQSYDSILDPVKRFEKFHFSLSKWINLDRSSKIKCLEKSNEIINHNLNLYKKRNYVQYSYNKLRFLLNSLL